MTHLSFICNAFTYTTVSFAVIYDGAENQFTTWLQEKNVQVVFHNLTFMDKIKAASARPDGPRNHEHWYGLFLRYDIPFIMRNLKQNYSPFIDYDYVLYTDVDTFLLRDIDSCTLPKPKFCLLGSEHEQGTMKNTGVLYINVSRLETELKGFVDFCDSRNFIGAARDQGLFVEYFKGKYEQLPDVFNWKPYWPLNNASYILHNHGPKFGSHCVNCALLSESILSDVCKVCPDVHRYLLSEGYKADKLIAYKMYSDIFFKTLAQCCGTAQTTRCLGPIQMTRM